MMRKNKYKEKSWIVLYVVEKPNGDVVDKFQYFCEEDSKEEVLKIAEKQQPAGTLKIYVYKAQLIAIDDDNVWEKW